jgi:hypothetical protein
MIEPAIRDRRHYLWRGEETTQGLEDKLDSTPCALQETNPAESHGGA